MPRLASILLTPSTHRDRHTIGFFMTTSVFVVPLGQEPPGSGASVARPSGVATGPLADRSGSSFTALTRSIHELGLMRRRYGYYWTKLIGAVIVLIAWVVGFVLLGDSWWQLANATLLAVIMTQIAFLGHDAAHRQMFRSGRWNDWVSLIIANLLVGISYGWWQSKHNRHHANPNKEGADPDIAFDRDRHDPRDGHPPPKPTNAVDRGPSRLVLLPHPAPRGRLATHRRHPPGGRQAQD